MPLPRPALSPEALGKALRVMTDLAQTLLVVSVVRSTLAQRLDVIALRGQLDAPQALTLNAQGIASKQAIT